MPQRYPTVLPAAAESQLDMGSARVAIAENVRNNRVLAAMRWLGDEVLAVYGLVLFGAPLHASVLLLAATWVAGVPSAALGLLSLLLAQGLARVLLPNSSVSERNWLACNALLTGLYLGALYAPNLTLLALAAMVTLAGVLLAAALRSLVDRYLGIPLLSLPFVVASWGALLLARHFPGLPLAKAALAEPLSLPLSDGPREILRLLAAIFMQNSAVAGLLVGLAWLLWSRWSLILALLGILSGQAILALLGGTHTGTELAHVGFNAALVAVACGGVFVVLSKSSLIAACLAGALATLLGIALQGALLPLNLPVLAAPFVLLTQGLLLALHGRLGPGPLQLVLGPPLRPEDNLHQVLQSARRYPPVGMPLLYLPVLGRWRVTQGPRGALTHQGQWAHAWDFEVENDQGERFRGEGQAVQDFYAWGAPVVAPGDGRVVRVINHLEDQEIGHVDLAHNWGNMVVVAHSGGVFSALSHLQQGSIGVHEGQTVVRGEVLGRVGNSGRSPVPHLHVQVQASAEVGAPTLPAQFLHFLQIAVDEQSYQTCGSPQTGALLQSLATQSSTARAFAFAPGTQIHWLIHGQQLGPPRRETWSSELDALGRRTLKSNGAAASIYIDDSYATVLDYTGPADTLLAMYAVAAARVPFAAADGVTWHDSPSILAHLSKPVRILLELLMPFGAQTGVPTHSRLMQGSDGTLVLETKIRRPHRLMRAKQLPDRLQLLVQPGVGPTALRAYRGDLLCLDAEVTL